MNGIINILKPTNMTSFDVVAYLRGLTGEKKIGHTGTLDPMATGVLPVCIGKATGVIDYIINKDKVYVCEITFGANTNTQDNMGDVIETFENNVTVEQIKKAIRSFEGEYMQIPPMYSAIKINGQKLCDIARKGKEVERTPRRVSIKDIKIIDIKDNKKAIFICQVSKGTYIRSLCYDIGKKLGVGAYMSFLVRTKVGNFDIDKALTLEEVKKLKDDDMLNENIISIDSVLDNYAKVVLPKSKQVTFLNGGFVKIKSQDIQDELFRVYSQNGDFLAIGNIVEKDGTKYMKAKKMFI